MNPRILLATCSLIFFFLFHASPIMALEIKVAVSSNFIHTLSLIANQFEQKTAVKITLITGSTGKHYAQIINGAPYDAFFAADVQRPLRLEQEGYVQQDSRFTYAIGQLVLWGPEKTAIDPNIDRLAEQDFNYLAIANPKLAPYGKATRQVLQAFNVWDPLKGRMVRGENIGQAYQFIKSGNAELGFVAYSQLKTQPQPIEGAFWRIPQHLYDPIEQQAVLLKDNPVAREFLAYCQSEQALQIIRANGYHTP